MPHDPLAFLAGGGEMGARMRAFDWSSTPLGPAAQWPQSLKTCVRVVLTSRRPMFVWWGDALINLYNDACKSVVGGKHPAALAQPASVVWREIWHQVWPRAEAAMRGDEGAFDEALLLVMERHGYPEETYCTFSYSPVPDDHGGTGGVFCAGSEDTARVVDQRQLALLRDLAARTADARTREEACELCARSLETSPRDIPFALLYLVDPARGAFDLVGAAGIDRAHPAAPSSVPLDAPAPWPLGEALRTRAAVPVDDLGARFEHLPSGAWPRPPSRAAVLPVTSSGRSGRAGALVVGLNPFRPFDDAYRDFVELVAGQVATSVADAQAHDEERRRAEAERPLATERGRVLVADDNADMRDDIARLLGAHWEVRAVADGAQALASARAEGFDLVITDVTMPGLDGFALLRALRDDPRTAGVPVIMLSARAGEESRVEGLEAGADDYLVKPFSGRELVARVRTHLALARARAAAVAASRAKDEFLAMLGHELRNPLAPIVTALQLLRRRSEAPAQAELAVIERQVQHLVRLVDDLLDVSRVTRGRLELKREPVELSRAIDDAIQVASPLLEKCRHHLRVDVAASGLRVYGDPVRLSQVVSNLLNNAAKYTAPGGHITVDARREGDRVVLRVRDDGIGIAPEMLPRVFDLFAQEAQAIDRSQGGLGLGLAIVRQLVELHGGVATAHSEGRGHGSEFVVSLPAWSGESSGDEPARRAREVTPATGMRVLVVDDNEDASEMLRAWLELEGHEVRTAHDGLTALDAAERHNPDAVLLDIGLPAMDGYEVARQLRRRPALRDVLLVAVTGYGQSIDRARSSEAGIDVHAVKPVDLDHLARVLAEHRTRGR